MGRLREGGHMNRKRIVKTGIDVCMIILLLFLMGYQFWGEEAHEWVGAGMFLLFLLHHLLNFHWYKSLFKGRYNGIRIIQTYVNMLVLVSMLALMYSGIVLSRHTFVFLPISGGLALARQLHILGSYWGFLLMSIHLGLHWNIFLTMGKKREKKETPFKFRELQTFVSALLIALYGLFVLIKRDFITYLFLHSEFVFLDYSEPVILFYIDYFALMGLCIFIAHYGTKGMRMVISRKEKL